MAARANEVGGPVQGIVWDGQAATVVSGLAVRGVGPREVRVRIVHAGLCHSDASLIGGAIPFPPPVVMGHEGAGIVEEVGAAVTHVGVGDHVVLSTLANCGVCAACVIGRPTMCRASLSAGEQPFTRDGAGLYKFAAVGSFVEETVVAAAQAIPIPTDIPLDAASIMGCAVLTGMGAVLNRARVGAGERAAVIGVGGIGLNVLQALRLCGADPIIAIDANPEKEAIARQFGATHFVDASAVEMLAGVQAIDPNGVDFAFECVGAKALVEGALDLLDWHGTLVILGVTPFGTKVEFLPERLYTDKTIMGCRYGSAKPARDIARYAALYRSGHLLLDELVSARYPLEAFANALDDLHHGNIAARAVLDVRGA